MKQLEYYDVIKEQLEQQFTEEKDTIEDAAQDNGCCNAG